MKQRSSEACQCRARFRQHRDGAVIRFFFSCKASKEINVIVTETLTCFLPSRAKDLSVPLYVAIPSLTSSVGYVTDTQSYSMDYVYANGFMSWLKNSDASMLRSIAIVAIRHIWCEQLCMEGFLGFEPRVVKLKVTMN